MLKVFALFCISILFVSCGERKEVPLEQKMNKEVSIAEKVKWVDTVHVSYLNIANEIQAEGKLYLPQTELAFEKSGKVVETKLREGKTVRKGDLLVQLDTSELSLKLQEALQAVRAARYRQHLLYLQRVIGYEKAGDSIPENAAKAIAIESGLHEALIQKEQASLALQKATERAPFAALVADVNITPFEVVSTGEVFCTLLNTEKMAIKVDLLEREVAQLLHAPAQHIIGTATFPEQGEQKYNLALGHINPLVNAQGFVNVSFQLLDKPEQPLQQMRAKVQILCKPRKGIAIPPEAILERDNRPVVFVYSKEKAIWRYIETGQKMQNAVEVRSGLEAGEALIITGHLNLAHLSTVKVVNP